MTQWEEMPVAALAGFRNGYAFKPEHQGSVGRPIVRIEQFLNADVEPARYDGADIPKRNHIEAGDLIFSWSGTLAVGVWDREPAYLNQHLFRVDPRPGIDVGWLRWSLVEAIERMTPWMHGSAMTHITRRVLEEVRVPVPPLEEQRRIADYLDTETARIDTLLTMNEQATTLVEERYQAFVEDAVSRVRAQHGDVALRYATERIMPGVDFAAADLELTDLPGHVRYVRTTDITDPDSLRQEGGVYCPRDWVIGSPLIKDGDLLLTRAGSVGTAYRHTGEPVAFAGYLVGVRPGRASSDWLRTFVESQTYWDQIAVGAVRSTIDNFSGSKYAAMRVPLPPQDEQQRLSGRVQQERWATRSVVRGLERQRDLLLERRQALITAAVTGEIEV